MFIKNGIVKFLRWLDENIEKQLIIISYSAMTIIIFIEILRRFLFNVQASWSTSIPVLLFLWLAWVGASLNVKNRTHLSLTEIRNRLPYKAQMFCLFLDAVLWIVFSVVVIFFSLQQINIAYENFAIVQGTDDVMQWWFYLATPIGWFLIIFRVLQNLYKDLCNYKNNKPLLERTTI